MDNLYKEFPLPDDRRHMRLVRLLPRQPHSKIRLELRVATLTELPYAALSYCWGSPEDPGEILFNGRPWSIRRNLWEFLSEMTRSGLLGDRPIFIDAICIDQDNVEERNAQVSIMAQIYKNAEEVLSWIGVSDTGSARFLSTLKSVEDSRRAFWSAAGQNVQKPAFATHEEENNEGLERRICLANALKVTYDDTGAQRLEDEENVFVRDYWQRVWIIQECLLSRHVTLVCGHMHLSMETLGWYVHDRPIMNDALIVGPEDVFRGTAQNNPGGPILLPRMYMSNLPNYATMFDFSEDPFGRFGLFKWLVLFGDRHCTDLRDKIYGFLGIATDFDPKARSLRRDGVGLVVDYSKPPLWLLFRVLSAFKEQHAMQFALLLRKLLGVEQYLPVLPPAEVLLTNLDMSMEEMRSPVFRLELKEQGKVGKSIAHPDATRLTGVDARMRISSFFQPDSGEESFVFTLNDAGDNDDLVAVCKSQVTAALIMRSRVLEEATVEKVDESYQALIQKRTVVRPGLLERECVGLAIVKTPRQSLQGPEDIWHLFPNTVHLHLAELSRLPIASLVGKRSVAPIDHVDDFGNVSTRLEYTFSWLEMFNLTSEHWFDIHGHSSSNA